MRVLDGAVIVLDGVRGVEPQTETVWRQASRFQIPTLFFVNKMDRPGASFDHALATLGRRLKAAAVPVAVPVAEGVLHVIDEQLWTFEGDNGEHVSVGPVPPHLQADLASHRENLLLALGDHDDEIAEAVLSETPVDPARVREVLRRCTLQRTLYPTFGGTALRNRGVQTLLDGVLDFLPCPLDRPPVRAHTLDGAEVDLAMDPKEPLAALAFKVQLWEGRRHVFARIYRGRLEPGDPVRIANRDQEERVARIFDVDADSKKRIDVAYAGQIVLLAGLRWATTGDTLCSPKAPVLLERIDTRDPVLGLAIEAERSRDEEKMEEAIRKVLEEDPTLRYQVDADTGQRILRGMGELHLQIVFERIQREFGVAIRAGRPHVVTRETVSRRASAEGSVDHVLEVDDKKVEIRARASATAEPLARDAGVRITAKPMVSGEGSFSPALQDAVQLGASDALVGGPIDGAPLQDLAVTVDTLELFGVASSAQAVRIAVSQAVRNAVIAAGGVVLGPIMKVEVVTPEEALGSVLGDLQARHAAILESHPEHGMATIQAECGLGALLGYATELRSITRGRGQFTSEFARFDLTS